MQKQRYRNPYVKPSLYHIAPRITSKKKGFVSQNAVCSYFAKKYSKSDPIYAKVAIRYMEWINDVLEIYRLNTVKNDAQLLKYFEDITYKLISNTQTRGGGSRQKRIFNVTISIFIVIGIIVVYNYASKIISNTHDQYGIDVKRYTDAHLQCINDSKTDDTNHILVADLVNTLKYVASSAKNTFSHTFSHAKGIVSKLRGISVDEPEPEPLPVDIQNACHSKLMSDLTAARDKRATSC